MLVPSSLFDVVLFGALLVAAVVDHFVPYLAGTASLLAVGLATYLAAQELSLIINRPPPHAPAARQGRQAPVADHSTQQESLSTGLALSAAGFIYYWWRNDSDLALLGLSVGLMMASLMVAICIISAGSGAWRQRSPKPVMTLALTTFGAVTLGVLAGLWTLSPMLVKIAVTLLGAAAWYLRDHQNSSEPSQEATTPTPEATARAAAGRWFVSPGRGSLLDRFVPVLILGAVLFLILNHTGASLLGPLGPAAAARSSTPLP